MKKNHTKNWLIPCSQLYFVIIVSQIKCYFLCPAAIGQKSVISTNSAKWDHYAQISAQKLSEYLLLHNGHTKNS